MMVRREEMQRMQWTSLSSVIEFVDGSRRRSSSCLRCLLAEGLGGRRIDAAGVSFLFAAGVLLLLLDEKK